jgi:polyhydroxybutyrate depolymerase
MSNGGLMSHRLACEMADTFKAIAPVAGTDNTTECHPSRPVSVIMFHAKDDHYILFNGGAAKAAFKDSTKVAEFTYVPETISRWVKRNGCNPTPQLVLQTPSAYFDLYSQCADNAQVEFCVTETCGHSWPGGFKRPRGGELTSKAISDNDLMWDFFKNQQ